MWGLRTGRVLGVGVTFVAMWPLWHKVVVVAWVIGAALLVIVVVVWLSRR